VAAGRMDQLITDSLNYSKAARQEMPVEPVDLAALLQGLLDTYPNLQADTADIEIAKDLPPVLGNEAALTQCFSNLLGNAVKFAKPGAKPKIRVWGEEEPLPEAGPAWDKAAGKSRKVRIWVEDDGIGIPAEAQERIFGIFQRATTTHEGTGIGLAIVKKVAQRMGGEVGVHSELGKGSRFWVLLPKAP
jgi:signal transduction histidine kinase